MKMLDRLQLELGNFTDSNSKHIALLQHESKGLKEGIVLLDSEKTTIQKNMRMFVDQYHNYVEEMDKWGNEVNKRMTGIMH